jgi:hypothetical protein
VQATPRCPDSRDYPPAERAPWLFGDGTPWGTDGSALLRLDPATFAATEIWHLAGAQTDYADIAFSGGSLWLLTDDGFLLQVELPS